MAAPLRIIFPPQAVKFKPCILRFAVCIAGERDGQEP